MEAASPACIRVIAGVNGAGKSSLQGASILERGGLYYNPDVASQALRMLYPSLSVRDANSRAWHEGLSALRQAVDRECDFTLESTLASSQITAELVRAAAKGLSVDIWYVGLETVDDHLRRVRERVFAGGHDIPEEDIRRRFVESPRNLLFLMDHLTNLELFDNTTEATPDGRLEIVLVSRGGSFGGAGHTATAVPHPRRILRILERELVFRVSDEECPEWARPIWDKAQALK